MLNEFVKNSLALALDFVYPNKCGFCGRVIPFGKPACSICEREVLGITSEWSNKRMDSALCDEYKSSQSFGTCVAAGYTGAVKHGMIRLKRFSRNTAVELCPILADRLLCLVDINKIDYITFVPISKRRNRLSGYNQSEIIAGILSELLKIPIASSVIIKTNDKSQHTQRSVRKRKELAATSYAISNKHMDISGKTILLCDDIVTTGSTLFACSKVLKDAGAKDIICAVLAASVKSPAGKVNAISEATINQVQCNDKSLC